MPADDIDPAEGADEGGDEAAARAAALRSAMKAVVCVGTNIRVATVDNFQVSVLVDAALGRVAYDTYVTDMHCTVKTSQAGFSDRPADGRLHLHACGWVFCHMRVCDPMNRCGLTHGSQGEEAKIIILSLTRNNSAGAIGFMKMANRINVMLSRAQHGMYILGNEATLRANTTQAPMWPQVLDRLHEMDAVGPELQASRGLCRRAADRAWAPA